MSGGRERKGPASSTVSLFLGLLLRPSIDKHNLNVANLYMHKVNILSTYKPTMHKEGYTIERPIPMKLQAYMKTKEIRKGYRRVREALEPMPRTLARIGLNQEGEEAEEAQRPQAEDEGVRQEREREKKRKRVELKRKREEREKMRKAEEKRAKRERLEEIARNEEEERVRRETAKQNLELFSSSKDEESQERPDAIGSNTANDGEDALDDDVPGSNTANEGEDALDDDVGVAVEFEENEEDDEREGEVAALPQGELEQPRTVNRHIYFPSLTPSATTSSDSGGRDTEIIQQELKHNMAHVEPSPFAFALDEVRSSLAVLRAESLTNSSHLDRLQELTASNAEILQRVLAHIQRDGASTSSQDTQALIPLNVPVDYVTQTTMNALGDRLLQKVANFTFDFNSIAKHAAVEMRHLLAAVKYNTDMEILKVTMATSEIVELLDAKIKAMPPTNVQKPKRKIEPPTACAEASKNRRLDNDEDPDQSGSQSCQEGENQPAATKSSIPKAAPSTSTPRQQAQAPPSQISKAAQAHAEDKRKRKMPASSAAEPEGRKKGEEDVIQLLSVYTSSSSSEPLSLSAEYVMETTPPSKRDDEEEVVVVNVADPELLRCQEPEGASIPTVVPLEEVIVVAPPPHQNTHRAKVPVQGTRVVTPAMRQGVPVRARKPEAGNNSKPQSSKRPIDRV
ncbi:uncharacterized abhydrolase domain-containing protein DDB_G0269086-like [Cynara cardunculus var. scolymus]|uniref:uncharacterized abhydrolase domain-containing protein DDB_G0269086-like n=1 Tax=Cynara cardunculus var. scolymus TaxID=59895 RepID=UPI000D62E69D|nr:uncharacterized abhydrolase domain-containing protein DDB_G0269086-like [Cynara cardunculus var. scolymus]